MCAVDFKERDICNFVQCVCVYIYHCILLFGSVCCVHCTSCLYSHQNNAKKQKKNTERDKRKESKNKRDLQAHFKHHSIANSISIEQLNWCLDTLNTLHCSPLYFGNFRKAPFILCFSATTTSTKTPLTSTSANNSNAKHQQWTLQFKNLQWNNAHIQQPNDTRAHFFR